MEGRSPETDRHRTPRRCRPPATHTRASFRPGGSYLAKTFVNRTRGEMLDGLRQAEHETPPLRCSRGTLVHSGSLAVEGRFIVAHSEVAINSAAGHESPAAGSVRCSTSTSTLVPVLVPVLVLVPVPVPVLVLVLVLPGHEDPSSGSTSSSACFSGRSLSDSWTAAGGGAGAVSGRLAEPRAFSGVGTANRRTNGAARSFRVLRGSPVTEAGSGTGCQRVGREPG